MTYGAKFTGAIEFVLKHEGGFVDHPADPGGATNYGVSLRWLSKQVAIGDFDDDGDVDAEDIQVMTREQAVEIYHDYWWVKHKYDRIADTMLATKVLDFSVNMGPRQAHRLLQRALNASGQKVHVDGLLGPKTFAATDEAEPVAVLAAIRSEAACFYRGLNRPEFINGWLRRAYA